MCGLAWGVRRPLQLEIADMREAKLEGGTVAISFSSMSNEEMSSCGVDGGMVANWRVCYCAFIMDTGLGPEGSGLTVDGWRSQGSDVEEDIEGLAGSERVDQERARTNLSLKKKALPKKRICSKIRGFLSRQCKMYFERLQRDSYC